MLTACDMHAEEAANQFEQLRMDQKGKFDAKDGAKRVKLKGIAMARHGQGVRTEDKTKMQEEITEAGSVHKRRRVNAKTTTASLQIAISGTYVSEGRVSQSHHGDQRQHFMHHPSGCMFPLRSQVAHQTGVLVNG